MVKELHSVNGDLQGAFYELDDGRKLYLAHRTPRHRIAKKETWGISESVLRECERRSIDAVGVIIRRGSRKIIYLTKRQDFYGKNSFQHYGNAVQRALPANNFRINQSLSAAAISKSIIVVR